MNGVPQVAFEVECPERRRFAFAAEFHACAAADDVCAFLRTAVTVLVTQGMSCAAVLDTLRLCVFHAFPLLDIELRAIVIEYSSAEVTWSSAGHADALYIADGRAHRHLRPTSGPLTRHDERPAVPQSIPASPNALIALPASTTDAAALARHLHHAMRAGGALGERSARVVSLL